MGRLLLAVAGLIFFHPLWTGSAVLAGGVSLEWVLDGDDAPLWLVGVMWLYALPAGIHGVWAGGVYVAELLAAVRRVRHPWAWRPLYRVPRPPVAPGPGLLPPAGLLALPSAPPIGSAGSSDCPWPLAWASVGWSGWRKRHPR